MAFRMEKLRQLWRLVRESHAQPLVGEVRKPTVLGVEEQAATGVTPELVRLSVGIEDVRDILADLEQAIAKATSGELVAG